MPSTTNLEGEKIVDSPGKDGNTSMPEQVKRPNPWRKMMMTILHIIPLTICYCYTSLNKPAVFFLAVIRNFVKSEISCLFTVKSFY
jgi:hypothetical protein